MICSFLPVEVNQNSRIVMIESPIVLCLSEIVNPPTTKGSLTKTKEYSHSPPIAKIDIKNKGFVKLCIKRKKKKKRIGN